MSPLLISFFVSFLFHLVVSSDVLSDTCLKRTIFLLFTARREKSIKNGRLPVVSQLCLLPKTTHDPNSFVVDINIVRVSNVLKLVLILLFVSSYILEYTYYVFFHFDILTFVKIIIINQINNPVCEKVNVKTHQKPCC